MGALKQLNRWRRSETKKAEMKKAIAENPVAKYMDELTTEIENLHKTYPSMRTTFKDQIELIRKGYEKKLKELREMRADIIDKMIHKIKDDYKDKEVFLLMEFMEYERDELKNIAKNNYGENQTSE